MRIYTTAPYLVDSNGLDYVKIVFSAEDSATLGGKDIRLAFDKFTLSGSSYLPNLLLSVFELWGGMNYGIFERDFSGGPPLSTWAPNPTPIAYGNPMPPGDGSPFRSGITLACSSGMLVDFDVRLEYFDGGGWRPLAELITVTSTQVVGTDSGYPSVAGNDLIASGLIVVEGGDPPAPVCFWTDLIGVTQTCGAPDGTVLAEYPTTHNWRIIASDGTYYVDDPLSGLPVSPSAQPSPETVNLYAWPTATIHAYYGSAPAQIGKVELAGGQFRTSAPLTGTNSSGVYPGYYGIADHSTFAAYIKSEYPYIQFDLLQPVLTGTTVFTGTALLGSAYGWSVVVSTGENDGSSEIVSSSDTEIVVEFPACNVISSNTLYLNAAVYGGSAPASEYTFVSEALLEIPGRNYQAGTVTDLFRATYPENDVIGAAAPDVGDRSYINDGLPAPIVLVLLHDSVDGYYFRPSDEAMSDNFYLSVGDTYGTLHIDGVPVGLVRFVREESGGG